ncbi:Yeats-domain-containing protein [Pyrenophora tritici-repentis]|nr:Yeats-domain-containing protein [Pyrenophora tritici-repentis]
MPAPASNKRNKRISRNLIIGSEAWQLPPVGHPDRPKNVPDDHTKRWTVYVRVPDGDPDIRAWLNKVSFKIFNTYENPLRMVEKPPFEVTETGWGGFNIDIRLHFQPLSGEKAQYRQHFLQLEKYGDEKMQAEQERTGCVRSEFLEVVQFNEPTEALFDALTSEDQWNYLIPAGKGGSKKASLGANGRLKRGLPNGERSAQLPEKGADEVPFSQEQEQANEQQDNMRLIGCWTLKTWSKKTQKCRKLPQSFGDITARTSGNLQWSSRRQGAEES